MTEKRFILIEYVNKGLFIQDNANDETQYFQGSKASLEKVVDLLNELQEENEQLKKELKKYTDAFDCSQCRFQNYDWFDDGDEFEVCEKGNNEAQMEYHSCSKWEEF